MHGHGHGHEVVVASRDKDMTVQLLDAYDIPHTVLTKQRTGRAGLAAELATRVISLSRLAQRSKADVLLGIMGPAIVLAGKNCARSVGGAV